MDKKRKILWSLNWISLLSIFRICSRNSKKKKTHFLFQDLHRSPHNVASQNNEKICDATVFCAHGHLFSSWITFHLYIGNSLPTYCNGFAVGANFEIFFEFFECSCSRFSNSPLDIMPPKCRKPEINAAEPILELKYESCALSLAHVLKWKWTKTAKFCDH